MTRILIADDHAVFRRGVKEILGSEFDDLVCGQSENGHQTLAQVQAHGWDLLILDLSMPVCSGMEVLNALREMRAKVPVLVLTMHDEDIHAKRVLKAGARGYATKGGATEELIKAVRKVLAGGRYISESLAERLMAGLCEFNRPAHEALSGREFEILQKIASGKTLSQIAEELHLAITTISTYRSRILEKVHKTTTGELIRYAIENHLPDS